MTAVTALPDSITILCEDKFLLDIVKKLLVALLVLLLNGSNHFEKGGYLIEAFLLGLFGKGWVHFCPRLRRR